LKEAAGLFPDFYAQPIKLRNFLSKFYQHLNQAVYKLFEHEIYVFDLMISVFWPEQMLVGPTSKID
jgi:hypothetical protein